MNEGGAIVLVSSSMGVKPSPNTAGYGASKAALLQLARIAALEAAPRQNSRQRHLAGRRRDALVPRPGLLRRPGRRDRQRARRVRRAGGAYAFGPLCQRRRDCRPDRLPDERRSGADHRRQPRRRRGNDFYSRHAARIAAPSSRIAGASQASKSSRGDDRGQAKSAFRALNRLPFSAAAVPRRATLPARCRTRCRTSG